MARHNLTDAKVRNAKPGPKAYKLADGGGLFLHVQSNGSRLWRFRYWLEGKEQLFAIGSYPELSLAAARAAADDARALAKRGINPAHAREEERRRNLAESEARKREETSSFEKVATAWLQEWKDKERGPKRTRGQGWTAKTLRNKRNRVEKYLVPALGSMPVSQITPRDLRPIIVAREKDGAWAALHTKSDLVQIFAFALAKGYCDVNPARDLELLGRVPKTESKAALTLAQVRTFFIKLRGYRGYPETEACLRFIAFTACRPGEGANAEWSEFRVKEDGLPPGGEWTEFAAEWDELPAGAMMWCRPAAKMKARRPHVSPLSDEARAAIEEMRPISGHGRYVFPDRSRKTHTTTERLRYAMRNFTLGERTSPHCWRATFSTWANKGGFRADAIERQLAHVETNKVRAAYNQAQLLTERRGMVGAWGKYLAAAEAENVIPLPVGRTTG